ncbi:hypothetical protein F1C16_06485 [Hymenobacter sp. NBH84]|uniref:glycoside hydrolase family 2 TIM barrel-domain containing protein n=1 Tax=Hymenobacter sp. NBH84 TaxID=2596915 RepID=UPI0016233934|nr:glycoside hydrolase family 2 TIM barrel-domain containing protein [Hymenobacter sp. NBH84]QNE39230.1 hypothetical protein F1C16_06485 [Hymenobacter sp. NBH84]
MTKFVKCLCFKIIAFAVVIASACSSDDKTHTTGAAVRASGILPVQIVTTPTGYQLLRGGKPYFIKGAAGLQYFNEVRLAGGNSVRLWSTDYAEPLLEEAQRQGLTVTLGLWMPHNRSGFDYHDQKSVAKLMENLREEVIKYRNSPALLMWSLGNELNMHIVDPNVYQVVNEAARMIHELDPFHPVTTILDSSLNLADAVRIMSPEIDLLSVNTFGGLRTLPQDLQRFKWTKPYIVTEFGAKGYWESDSTAWGAPLEQTSTEKAVFLQERYQESILADSTHCLGSYIFYWGQKNEMTPTWFSLTNAVGEKTQAIDVMYKLWSHQPAPNAAPQIRLFELAGKSKAKKLLLQANETYSAQAVAFDPDGDSLTTRWEILPEGTTRYTVSVGDDSPLEPVPGSIKQVRGIRTQIRMPSTAGYYRLYVTVSDGHGSVATANQPFRCYE